MPSPLRILGVDPGLTRCGLGVVDALPGRRVAMVAVGVATSQASAALPERLVTIADALDSWLEAHRPDAVAVEAVFAKEQVRSLAGTAQVAGLAMVAAQRRGIAVVTHTPSEVKAAVTGDGRAAKEQVQAMVARILGLSAPPRPADAADALALAICHAWRSAHPAAVSSPGAAMRGRPPAGPAALTPAQKAWAQAEAASRDGAARRVAPALPHVGR